VKTKIEDDRYVGGSRMSEKTVCHDVVDEEPRGILGL